MFELKMGKSKINDKEKFGKPVVMEFDTVSFVCLMSYGCRDFTIFYE